MSSNTHPTVSVILLSYNRPELLRHALDSLAAQTCPPFEIVVVDNHSSRSADVAWVVEQFPLVKMIQNSVNLGYAAGMNLGIKEATGQYTYLTEDDIVLDKDCLRQLVEYLEEHRETALASAVMYNEAAGTIRCAGGEVALGGIYRRKIYDERDRGAKQFSQPFDVSYLDGATMFARTNFLQSTGGFREEFFMYVEAVEFCVRVARAGKKLTVVPAARVYHFEPTPGPHSPEIEFHKIKNFFSLYLLHAPARAWPEFFCRYAVVNGVRSLFGRNVGAPEVFFKALLWVALKTPSILKERRAERVSLKMC
jgi:GT2 family glycosyltransferase